MHCQRDLKIDPTSLETGELVGDAEWKFMLFAFSHMSHNSKQWSVQKQVLLTVWCWNFMVLDECSCTLVMMISEWYNIVMSVSSSYLFIYNSTVISDWIVIIVLFIYIVSEHFMKTYMNIL